MKFFRGKYKIDSKDFCFFWIRIERNCIVYCGGRFFFSGGGGVGFLVFFFVGRVFIRGFLVFYVCFYYIVVFLL